jgi:plasmid maintenance system antidote protein VapI
MKNAAHAVYKPPKPATPLEALEATIIFFMGNQSAAAKHLGIPRQHVSDILSGKRSVSESLAKALGFRKRVIFERIAKR